MLYSRLATLYFANQCPMSPDTDPMPSKVTYHYMCVIPRTHDIMYSRFLCHTELIAELEKLAGHIWASTAANFGSISFRL